MEPFPPKHEAGYMKGGLRREKTSGKNREDERTWEAMQGVFKITREKNSCGEIEEQSSNGEREADMEREKEKRRGISRSERGEIWEMSATSTEPIYPRNDKMGRYSRDCRRTDRIIRAWSVYEPAT